MYSHIKKKKKKRGNSGKCSSFVQRKWTVPLNTNNLFQSELCVQFGYSKDAMVGECILTGYKSDYFFHLFG